MRKSFGRNPEDEPQRFSSDKIGKKGQIPCVECNTFHPINDMIRSEREGHGVFTTKKKEWGCGKLCAFCCWQCCLDEKEEVSLSEFQEVIAGNKKQRQSDRVGAWQRATAGASAQKKATRAQGIFTHNKEGTRKTQRKSNIAQLLGEHLITACCKADLNSVFTKFAGRM